MCASRSDFRCRYARQVLVPEIGHRGHNKLRQSKILIAGCGGLGSAVIPLLAASGVGRLVVCDDDTVRISNLNRQTIYREQDVGRRKVRAAAEFIKHLNSDVEVREIDCAIGPKNFETILSDVEIVVDCVDRLAVKMFLNDACVATHKTLVHCAAIGFTGEVMVIPPGGRPCYRCFFEGKQVSTKLNCANAGVASPTVGVVGSMAAAEVIKYVVGSHQSSVGKLYRVDLRSNRFTSYELSANSLCSCCSDTASVDPHDFESYEGKLRIE
ncbi:HesA/MoeB/ThiF family protein [Anaplasma marginale]|uniref:Thiamine biosynthesis protein (ThiF) n=1 Tax=Anaplasma marginale (strain Florida) TaxID=320483 RepID=B9KHJ3_ANAMF|nr:HesA/MoeB/ThiF family protein [Anaplasma marginale]AAV86245.1 thiamine biosynthesis protein [Anaplasma marginale str. St. Maries]ACM48955.1 thiamine biosynthesis protein (thiF) [Anaplasma marginale str. Florida]KAA8472045.1 HesA/MoeB/ThiF family protein [Anaplasma marginale]KAB0451023.1 HesA/MoeB/ThiF family protein [Anaplasma marginale]